MLAKQLIVIAKTINRVLWKVKKLSITAIKTVYCHCKDNKPSSV